MDKILDGRYKLLDCQIERIRQIKDLTGISYAKIATQYFGNRISRQTIYLMCNPEKHDKQRLAVRRALNSGKYYDKGVIGKRVKSTRNKNRKLKSLFSSSK